MRIFRHLCFVLAAVLFSGNLAIAETLGSFDEKVKEWASACRDEIVTQFDLLLTSGRLSVPQLFDTFYVPIPGTDPQKYHTQYDRMVDGILQPILDKYLARDERLMFVVAVDRNGYLPTHNTRYARPLTGNANDDVLWNRTKRIFNDRTGLAAARNEKTYLLQRYSRDTGEEMADLSVPVNVQNRHWGAVRFGYKQSR